MRNRYFLALDIILLPLAAYASFWLRLESFDLNRGEYVQHYLVFAALAAIIIPLVFLVFGLYRRFWRYASVGDAVLLSGLTLLGVMATTLAAFLVVHLRGWGIIPRSVPIIFLFLALAATAGPRLLVRVVKPGQRQKLPQTSSKAKRVLIMGAGDAGTMILRELRNNPKAGMEVVGFIDDDPRKIGASIAGVRVLGDRHDLPRVAAQNKLRNVIIAMPAASGKTIREIVTICQQAGLKAQVLPGIAELLKDEVSIKQLRNVQIEDLLRRPPIHTDTAAVRELLTGKRVLITGGGGSIGAELCRQVLRCEPALIVVVGHGENSIFTIQNELKKLKVEIGSQKTEIVAAIGDMRSRNRMRYLFEHCRPEVVFHAAAHKHVPLMEADPGEAVMNNVLGTRILLEAARDADVSHFVFISTDKAVNPTSIMGSTKRVAELLVSKAALETGRPYVMVRFGNVLGSRGSVVLTFKQQIAAGGPVTVTHPEMTRFFMTIPEAVQLVLQSAALGSGGEVFMLDMGQPVKILDLAHDLIHLSGLEVGRDIDIEVTGIRPGEKLYEELFVPGETYKPTRHDKIFIAVNASNARLEHLGLKVEALIQAADCDDRLAIIQHLKQLVPEYKPQQEAVKLPEPASPSPIDD